LAVAGAPGEHALIPASHASGSEFLATTKEFMAPQWADDLMRYGHGRRIRNANKRDD
jgi:hypothetical protein